MVALILPLLLLLQGPGSGSDKTIQETLNKKYARQLLTLRGFLSGTPILFDAGGKMLSGGKPGIFTLDGTLRVEALNVAPDKIEIRARHVFLEYNSKTRKLDEFATNDRIRLEFARKPGVAPEIGLDAVLLPMDRLVAEVPVYWKRFVLGESNLLPIVDPVTGVAVARASEDQGLVPKLVHQVTPVYPEILRGYGTVRSVVLRVVVDERGRPEVADIAEPAGFGLDQSAADAVHQWEYEPAKKDGKAVKTYFRVRVNFNPPR